MLLGDKTQSFRQQWNYQSSSESPFFPPKLGYLHHIVITANLASKRLKGWWSRVQSLGQNNIQYKINDKVYDKHLLFHITVWEKFSIWGRVTHIHTVKLNTQSSLHRKSWPSCTQMGLKLLDMHGAWGRKKNTVSNSAGSFFRGRRRNAPWPIRTKIKITE